MNEAQTRLDKIDPKLRDAGWGIVPGSNILAHGDSPRVNMYFHIHNFIFLQ